MKKLMILILLSAFTLPIYALARDTPSSYQNKIAQDTFHPYQSYQFESTATSSVTYDYLGYLIHDGVNYHCYGTYPWIYQIDASVGTVYSFSPCGVNMGHVNTYIESSNGNFYYDDFIWND
jgi:hypothetical protein